MMMIPDPSSLPPVSSQLHHMQTELASPSVQSQAMQAAAMAEAILASPKAGDLVRHGGPAGNGGGGYISHMPMLPELKMQGV